MESLKEIEINLNIEGICKDKDSLLFAVPSVFVRSTARIAANYVADDKSTVDVEKGIEPDIPMMMSDLIP